ncbi:aminotransferase class I/II-fold pyridoxal phosphate-dependent enzyme (plasmid) [Pantoea sp. C3]|uniref:aminotransferase class I/II-fold pyridoxal phosphate-dependent enzyme n=1 Tax=Pantoea phytostimulans TaxID=2769024 RepID=UPI0038F61892
MKYTSDLVDQIEASASVMASQKAREMKASGINVISLAAGEPDFPTPPHVVEAAKAAIDKGQTKYADVRGTLVLRQAIQSKFERDNNLRFSLDEIMVGPGAKSLIATVLMASVNPGDEIIIPAPSWVSYVDIARLVNGLPVVVETVPESGLKLDPVRLEAAITDKSRWLLLNSPGNPTGSVYTKDELVALATVLERHPHVMVLSDEIYEYLVFDNVKFVSFLEAAPQLRDRVVTLNGASKGYAMTGWRIGYSAAPAALTKGMAKVAGQMVGSSSSISQAAAVAAMDGPQGYLAERATSYQSRRDRVLELLSAIPGLTAIPPQGAFYLYVNCGGILGRATPKGEELKTDSDVVNYLLEAAAVVTVTGAAYGLSPYFRISIATDIEQLEEACHRISMAIEELQ